MFLLPAFISAFDPPILHKRVISQTSHDSLPLNPHDEVIIEIGESPLILFIPRVIGFSVDIYKKVETANIFIGNLAQLFSSAVYFRSGGRIIVSATVASAFEYFAIRPTRICPIFRLTTAPLVEFSADQTANGADLTIKNNQKFCIFHLSDSSELTSVAVNYSTEEAYDVLYFSDGGGETALSGRGLFEVKAQFFSLFAWISDASTLSDFFKIRLSAPRNGLPVVMINYTAKSWPDSGTEPVILQGPRGRSVPPATQGVWANADAEHSERREEREQGRPVAAIVACVVAGVVGMGGVWICVKNRPRGTDQGLTVMLDHEDIGGVGYGRREMGLGPETTEADRLSIDQPEDTQA
jgi:hypothetical protein